MENQRISRNSLSCRKSKQKIIVGFGQNKLYQNRFQMEFATVNLVIVYLNKKADFIMSCHIYKHKMIMRPILAFTSIIGTICNQDSILPAFSVNNDKLTGVDLNSNQVSIIPSKYINTVCS